MSALNQLPADLIEAILPFLPPKSLGRFKSVSKRWYSLISSSSFIKTHIQKCTKNNPNPDPTHLTFVMEGCDNPLYSVDIKQLHTLTTPAIITAKCLNFQEQWDVILGSCNGLLLANDRHGNLFVVNPTTGKTLKVPAGKSIDGTYGFGYDSSADDYKVIFISYKGVSDPDSSCKFVSVYSLRNNSWNMLTNLPYQQYQHYSLRPGVLLNDNLHWVVTSRLSKMAISAFSLVSEGFHEMELPYPLNYDRPNNFHVFALGGKLVAVRCDELYYAESISELCVMEEYGVPKSWKKLCIFQNNMDLWFVFIAHISNMDILLGINDENQFCIYNTDERRCTSVTIEGHREGIMLCGTYVESLESLERFR